MRLKPGRYILLFFIVVLIFFPPFARGDVVHASGNGSIVAISGYSSAVPPEARQVPQAGADGQVSFWQLPTWIQVAFISAFFIAALGALQVLPFTLGRLKHALENPKTRDIFHFIQRNPGATISEVSEGKNINRGTLKYHLGQLLASNKIIFRRIGKFSRIFYNNQAAMDMDGLVLKYMRNDRSQALLFAIMSSPGITNQELSQRFTLDKHTIHDHLKKFLNDNIVEFRQDGKFKRCYLTHDARIVLLRYKPN